jgi:small subunit ribosomal protein S21|tara:strand:- start:95 stop:340 length:246 start_codon:yes stop_codon:yes gene_type:complete
MVETLSINHALKEGKTIVEVSVKDNNVEGALRILKKKMQREGIFKEMKMRSYFEKPSQKKLREKAENIRRSRKMARRKIYS